MSSGSRSALFDDETQEVLSVPYRGVHRRPNLRSEMLTEIVLGERIEVLSQSQEWTEVLAAEQQIRGFVQHIRVSRLDCPATHTVTAARAPLRTGPSIRHVSNEMLTLGSKLVVTEQEHLYSYIEDFGWVPTSMISPTSVCEPDIVRTSSMLLETPHVWGGTTSFGLDCSGLLFLSLRRAGVQFPRSLAEQIKSDKIQWLDVLDTRQKADIVFFDGHVAIFIDDSNVIHCGSEFCKVTVETYDHVRSYVCKEDPSRLIGIGRIL